MAGSGRIFRIREKKKLTSPAPTPAKAAAQDDTPEDSEASQKFSQEKIKFIAATYLREGLAVHPFANIKTQKQFLETQYDQFYLNTLISELENAFHDLKTDFVVWRVLDTPDYLKELISREFINQHYQILSELLPPKKSDKLFVRSLRSESQRRVFDRMVTNKFEDMRRILNQSTPLNMDQKFQAFNYLKIKLAELVRKYKPALMGLFRGDETPPFPNWPIRELLADIFLSDALNQWLLSQSEGEGEKQLRQFYQETGITIKTNTQPFIPLTIACLELFHERADLFGEAEKKLLENCLTEFEAILNYTPNELLHDEELVKALTLDLSQRAQKLYEVSAGTLTPLYQHLQEAHQTYQSTHALLQHQAREAHLATAKTAQEKSQIRAARYEYDISHLSGYKELQRQEQGYQKLAQLYQEHINELTEKFHQRLYTLNQLIETTDSDGSPRSNKAFLRKKISNCLDYIQVSRRKDYKSPGISLKYRKVSSAQCKQIESRLEETYPPEAHEVPQYKQMFQKVNQILSHLNQSRSTVKLNLKQVFEDEPTSEQFEWCLQTLLEDFEQLDPLHPVTEYLDTILGVYKAIQSPVTSVERDPYTAYQRAGQIVSHLVFCEYKKLMIDLQYVQINYQFSNAFELTQAILMLEHALHTPNQDLDALFRSTLLPAWNCLTSHCLAVGKNQFNLLFNPTAIFEYAYPLSETSENEETSQAKEEAKTESTPEKALVPVSKTKALVPHSSTEEDIIDSEARALNDDDDEYDDTDDYDEDYNFRKTPQKSASSAKYTPESEEDRKIAFFYKPGKFQIYSAPQARRRPVPSHHGVSLDEDELHSLMHQTQVSPPTPTSPAESPSPQESTQNFSQEPEQVEVQTAEETFTEPPTPKRKRWLEITPSPAETDYYQHLDSALDKVEKNKPKQSTEVRNYNDLVDQILKNNQLSDSEDLDISATITQYRKSDSD